MTKKKKVFTAICDGLVNILSGMGTAKDKASATKMTRRSWSSFAEQEDFYTEFWLARKVVDTPAKDMTRKWRQISGEDITPEMVEEFNEEERRLNIKGKFLEAVKWARLYGGALIIPVFNNTEPFSMSEPLNIEKITLGSLRALTVVDKTLAHPTKAVTQDPTKPNYLKPDKYTLAGAVDTIHHTRVTRVNGLALPRRQTQIRNYWGQSVIDLLHKALIDALTSSDSGASLLHELNLDILSVKGLSTALSSGQEESIKGRFETYAHLKSIWNLVVIDSEEQFNDRPMQLGNLDKVIEKFYDLVAGATDIPVTKLLGQSARGLNSTGEHEEKNYHDFISCEQEEVIKQPLYELDRMIAMSLWGHIPKGFKSEFQPLGQMTEKEEAEVEVIRATRDQVYVDMGIIREDQILKELKQNSTYDNITDDDITKVEQAVKEANEQDDLIDADDTTNTTPRTDTTE